MAEELSEPGDKPKLKLYVVGQLSGDPSEWTDSCDWSLVLAENEDQAMSIGSTCEVPVSEIKLMGDPALLHRQLVYH